MIQELEKIIAETTAYRDYCRKKKLGIDAAACSIRIAALKQALAIVKLHGPANGS